MLPYAFGATWYTPDVEDAVYLLHAHGSELDSTTLKQYAAYIPLDYK